MTRSRDQKKKKRKNPNPDLYATPPEPAPTGVEGSPPRRQPGSSPSPLALKNSKAAWDVENVHIPKGEEVQDCVSNFRNNIRSQLAWEIHQFDAFKVDFEKVMKRKLQTLGLVVHDVKASAENLRDEVDIELECDLNVWMVLNEPPAPVLLIVSDQDYVRLLERLIRHGYNVRLVTGPTPARQLDKYMPLKWLEVISSSANPLIPLNLPQPLRRIIEIEPSESLLPRVMVFWDLFTCPLPSDIDPRDIKSNIEKALKQLGFLGVYKIEGFVKSGKSDTLSQNRKNILKRCGINLTTLQPPLKGLFSQYRDFIDVRISKLMCLWCLTREPPSPILLISDDKRFAWTVSELCTKAKFHILLAHGGEASQELQRGATSVYLWPDIASGTTGVRDTGKKKKKKNKRAEEGKHKRQKR